MLKILLLLLLLLPIEYYCSVYVVFARNIYRTQFYNFTISCHYRTRTYNDKFTHFDSIAYRSTLPSLVYTVTSADIL